MTWTIDLSHSEIGFNVRHMMISKVKGSFADWSAKLEIHPDDWTSSTVEAEIQVASIRTGDEKRDGHLQSADFFDVEKHPTMQFRSTGVEAAGAGRYTLKGDLTIRGVTRPVTLDATVEGPAKDPWGNQRIGVSLQGEIDRDAFGLNWNQALEAGGFLVGKVVKLDMEVQAMST